ncbi:hypothetical protein AGLY_000786 [Aphis glycines]|uniref:SCP domain-containing protein n=1 Tax=Aphis glycines TaxID=307491 RepID=A0A6G0U8H0_APHGL|nr:hypothetical protein AGLY_000786 [Aphis glycines]
MVKPIYCNLLLIFSCLIYEAYGGHHKVRYIKYPSHVISNNIRPYDEPSSSTTINDAGDNAATLEPAAQPSPLRLLKKPFSSNNGLEYNRNRGLVQDNKSSNYFGPHDLSSSSNTANVAGEDSEEQSSPLRLLKKLINSNDASQFDGNRRSIHDMISSSSNKKPLSDLDNRNNSNDQIDTTLNDPSIQNKKNRMNFEDLNKRPLSSLNSRNMQSLNFPSIGKTIITPSVWRLGSTRQNSLFPSLNEDDSQGISDGNENSNIMNMMNFNKNIFNNPGHKIVGISLTRCCINNKCRVLKEGEKCDIVDLLKDMKNIKQQNGNDNSIMTNLMGENLTPLKLMLFNRLNTSSFGSSKGMPYMDSEKKKPNYPYSEPIGVNKDEANKIQNEVLQKSNVYRKKFGLVPFTLDDQLKNCAQDWANYMAENNFFDHREHNFYGENLYGRQSLNNLGEIAVDSWYNEMSLFTSANKEKVATLHMTQLLWKVSTKLGVGVALNSTNNMYYVVANYDPKGNVLGNFEENLPKITKKDIEEAKVADEKLKAESTNPVVESWSSGSSNPFGSEWNY